MQPPATALAPDEGREQCSEFKADAALSKRSAKFDITAVGGVFCRHGFILLLLNLFTGERWGYATLLLHTLFAVHHLAVQFFWYDINCRYGAHFNKWLELQRPGLSDSVWEAMGAMQFPVPPFHLFAHILACQLKNSARTMLGAGRGTGEGPKLGLEEGWIPIRGFDRVRLVSGLGGSALAAGGHARAGQRLPVGFSFFDHQSLVQCSNPSPRCH